eukprot:36824_1
MKNIIIIMKMKGKKSILNNSYNNKQRMGKDNQSNNNRSTTTNNIYVDLFLQHLNILVNETISTEQIAKFKKIDDALAENSTDVLITSNIGFSDNNEIEETKSGLNDLYDNKQTIHKDTASNNDSITINDNYLQHFNTLYRAHE